jgi:hypothetical protein
MRIGRRFGFVLLLSSALCAQTRSGAGGVVHPGGNLPGVTRTLGSVVNPAQGGLRVSGNRSGGVNNNRVVSAYPIFIGGYYPTPYLTPTDALTASPTSSDQGPTNNITVVMPPQQPVTPVVINYNYGSAPPAGPSQTMDRAQAAAPEDATSDPSHYLIAFKDHTIYAATAYWVDGDTLHYFTAGNVHNQASLALVDRDFTERLNREAGLDVRIPAPSK